MRPFECVCFQCMWVASIYEMALLMSLVTLLSQNCGLITVEKNGRGVERVEFLID
jgi:hypothetical protein